MLIVLVGLDKCEVLGLYIWDIVIFAKNCITAGLIIDNVHMLLNNDYAIKHLLDWLALHLVIIVPNLILAFILEELLPRNTKHTDTENYHNYGDDGYFDASEEQVV